MSIQSNPLVYPVHQMTLDTSRRFPSPATGIPSSMPVMRAKNTTVGSEMMEHTDMPEGLEVTDEVFQSEASIVFDQAESRLHTIKAILVATLS